jgi:riboflavin kinase/FMN adenylyltransferase
MHESLEMKRVVLGKDLRSRERNALVIGNFDGVHRGHQAMLRGAKEHARAHGSHVAVLTFEPHPAEVLGRGRPPVLTRTSVKLALLDEQGVECTYICPFDAALANVEAEAFVRSVLVTQLAAESVTVGEGVRFGKNRRGDSELLRALGAELGFIARVHPLILDDGVPIGSTRIRELVAGGDVEGAGRLLGRPFTFAGAVVHGDKRGRQIGFPTANLGHVEEMLPGNGVYAVEASLDGRPWMHGVMNVGLRPTVAGATSAARRAEVYVFDCADDMYDASMSVRVLHKVRDEVKFDGVAALKAQIARDVESARAWLAARH